MTSQRRTRKSLSLVFAAAFCAAGCGEAESSLGTLRRALAPGELLINEVLANPDSTAAAGDANGDGTPSENQDEFVELLNATGSPIDVSLATLSDNASVRFTFPSGTVIPAGEAAVVFGGGSPSGEFGNARVLGLVFTASLGLNNTTDSVVLAQGGAELDRVVLENPADGVSLNRDPDGEPGIAFVAHDAVPGALGRFSPGARTDGRPFASHLFRAQPATGLTAGGVAVDLYGAGFPELLLAVNFRRGGAWAAAPAFQRKSSGLVTAVAPPFSAGPCDVEVVSAEGSATGAGLFTYVVSFEQDAGQPEPVDAGVPAGTDAGALAEDAGAVPPDAGSDAGALAKDAGAVPLDAGLAEDAAWGLPWDDDPEFPAVRDAGRSTQSAAPEVPGSGCGCGAGGAGSGLLGLLGLGVLRRRR